MTAEIASNSDKPSIQELLEEVLACGVSGKELREHIPGLAVALDTQSSVKFYQIWKNRVIIAFLGVIFFIAVIGLFICSLLLGALLGYHWPAEALDRVVETGSIKIMHWRGFDPHSERCFLHNDFFTHRYLDLFRPVSDCSFCRNISTIARVSGITPAQFEKQFAYSAVPVVVTDATVDWTAPKVFSFDFFRSIYSENSPALTANCQFFRYQSDFDSLADVFRMPKSRAELLDDSDPWYIGWSNCDATAANILRKYYSRPYFLPAASESSKTDWIFMGTPGYGANMHIDNVKLPSWQAQIRGQKTWIIEPPLECRLQCSSHRVTVNSGDVIVLDTNIWYHATWIEQGDMSITIGSEFD